MSAPALICAACGSPAVEKSAVVQDCSCGCRKMVYRPAMNWQERARRAEAIMDRMRFALGDLFSAIERASRISPQEWTDTKAAAFDAMLAYDEHRADYLTLEGRDG